MTLQWGQDAYSKEQLHRGILQLPIQFTCSSEHIQMQAPYAMLTEEKHNPQQYPNTVILSVLQNEYLRETTKKAQGMNW